MVQKSGCSNLKIRTKDVFDNEKSKLIIKLNLENTITRKCIKWTRNLMAASLKNRHNPHFLPKNYFLRSNIWNIFGDKIFPVLSNSKFVWFFNFTQNLSGMVMPPCPGKCLQEYGKILIALFLGRQNLEKFLNFLLLLSVP